MLVFCSSKDIYFTMEIYHVYKNFKQKLNEWVNKSNLDTLHDTAENICIVLTV